MAEKQPTVESIAAIATAPGRGGIGVVRVSGSGLEAFAKRLTGKTPQPRLAQLSKFLDSEGRPIDAGLMLFFPGPHSYTGEDVLELQGHGGPVVMRLLLARCLELGARLARPGEFTERAFLNDKLDLAQAEAVADLIDADTSAAARSALRSLDGDFSRQVHAWRDKLIELRMLVEATLDFPEEEIDFLRAARAFERLDVLGDELDRMLATARQGSLLRSGLHVVLAGQPNVGKSSLLNRLSGEDRAIVTDVAGTTRDVLRETIQIKGIPLHIIDTAGLRETEDAVERIGIARSWKEIGRADVVLRLVDARDGITAADHEIDARLPDAVPVIWAFNKIDLIGAQALRVEAADGVEIHLSAASGAGMDLLRAELLRVAGWEAHGEEVFLARERHVEALRDARERIALALTRAHEEALELMAEELRLAQEAVNRITGEFGADDLLGVIFSRFCIGK
ncbi:tRNA uridine-5-carboxymethylaminomethyl(34) synthesis GTPase MnmE [Niveibacterium sp. 24ML]|uniref:tRNA uridine-5-carboxymethylaminomethyl(34) synthesis GTPase MnmE n=1 Tax=Niveibacterium sp. 24ML TaxID=2985512 RepID=UPI00226E3F8E|nr:tRNA uridine-5-carboxymethylaminomethyl(34) synthesis GTPase MnmE [Niveibacterium sp. 24ML]MCX9155634.1 tRNA uridine-5-carboxymethylaminomethyl(34) synthesis GTPase MnmE [Niveibacterium sp. 24ML]